jgi:site-specific DNA recombinase
MRPVVPKPQRCAIYTRKSSEHNLDLEFNSLDAQREACEAYIKSQAHEGWRLNPDRYDDGGLSGASLDRPALQKLLADVRADEVGIVVVYKVDRLTRSLTDFAKLIELFDQHGVCSCRSPNPSTLPPAWAGSRSTFCSLLPSSSAR